MWYYYSYLFSILLINVDCFMFNKPSVSNIQTLFNRHTMSMTTNDYLSSIAFAPPFISSKVDTKPTTITETTVVPKVQGDYLSYIAFAPPFTSSKVNNTNDFTSTKLSNDYLSSIAIEPQSSPKYVKEQSSSSMSGTSEDYLSYISTAPPFFSTPVIPSSNVPTKPKTSNDYLSSIELPSLPSKTSSVKPRLQDDYLSSIALIRSKPNNYLSSLPSISPVKTQNVYPSNDYQSYTTSAINLPNYFYAIDFLHKELNGGVHLVNDLVDCLGKKIIKQSFPFF